MKKIIIFLIFLTLIGCIGVGELATPNADTKLSNAASLYRDKDQPVAAEELIQDAIAIFEKQNNLRGLGDAYYTYALLLRSPTVADKWASFYQEKGFKNSSITFANRISKSEAYLKEALDFYFQATRIATTQTNQKELMGLYFNMGQTAAILEDPEKACLYFSQAKNAHTLFLQQHPDLQQNVRLKNFSSTIDLRKQQWQCQ
ncbi:MAG: hypothetical protein IT497_00165 [Ottowia sp.]|nr:hypothetical protein [Ottowia sp.]